MSRPASKNCGVCQTRLGDGDCVHMPGTGTTYDPHVPTPVAAADVTTLDTNMFSHGPNGMGAFLPARYREVPAVHLFSVLTQAVPYGVHWPLAWDEVRYDTDQMFDEDDDPGRITIKTSGLYAITLNVRWNPSDDSAATGILAAYIRKNSTVFLSNDVYPLPEGSGVGGSGAFNKHSVTTTQPLVAGEFIQGVVYQAVKDGEGNPKNMRITVERWSPMFQVVFLRQLTGLNIPGVPESESV